MTDVVKTLLLPFHQGSLAFSKQKALFLNAEWDEGLRGQNITAQQFFKPTADVLTARDIETAPELPDGKFGLVLLLVPKQKTEMLWYIAQGLSRLAPGGSFICAASNDAGGTRLISTLESLGLAPESLSKHKARAVWISNFTGTDEVKLSEWSAAGDMQKTPVGVISQPGLFAWDRVDIGSEIFMRHLPQTLSGAGADFGCGLGTLSTHILKTCPKIKALTCIDADARAVEACRQNVASELAHFMWEDLRQIPAALPKLDFIVMNPPFHEGKKTLPEAGQAFIRTASLALKASGALYMVANVHLPYEKILAQSFKNVKPIATEKGFKVIYANGRI